MSRHESPEVGAMVRRMVRALVRRAGEGDWEALEELARLEDLMPTAMSVAGHLAWRGDWEGPGTCQASQDHDPRDRREHNGHRAPDSRGYSFTQLGNVLGVSRQAARQRFGVLPDTEAARWLCAPRTVKGPELAAGRTTS